MTEAPRFDPLLQKALADLLEANFAYVRAHEDWARGPEEKRMLQRGPLEEAAQRIDAARREASRLG